MDKVRIQELIDKFNLKNDLTKNPNIWTGHAKIGYRNRPKIDEVKRLLLDIFDEYIEEGEPTPEHLKEVLQQWEYFHPYQRVREIDQPMFISKDQNTIFVVVIWPWQIKEGVASLMLYKGEI
jgi:hypothetical protein